MTDGEIIKGLERCTVCNTYEECYECPYYECSSNRGCVGALIEDALKLIKCLNAEIDRLQECYLMYEETSGIKRAKAEAVEKFAERLISKISCIPQHHFTLAQVECDIDNLVMADRLKRDGIDVEAIQKKAEAIKKPECNYEERQRLIKEMLEEVK